MAEKYLFYKFYPSTRFSNPLEAILCMLPSEIEWNLIYRISKPFLPGKGFAEYEGLYFCFSKAKINYSKYVVLPWQIRKDMIRKLR